MAIAQASEIETCFMTHKTKAHVYILGSGAGIRFWPLSRPGSRKQLLQLTDTMLVGIIVMQSGSNLREDHIVRFEGHHGWCRA